MPSTIKKYEKRIETVEGFQFTGSNAVDIVDFTGGIAQITNGRFVLTSQHHGEDIDILSTNWIVRNGLGNFFCFSDYTFKTLYRLALD